MNCHWTNMERSGPDGEAYRSLRCFETYHRSFTKGATRKFVGGSQALSNFPKLSSAEQGRRTRRTSRFHARLQASGSRRGLIQPINFQVPSICHSYEELI